MNESKQETPRWIAGIEPAKEVLDYTGTQVLEMECRQQPEILRTLLRAYTQDATIVGELKKFREPAGRKGPVLFIGMGASYCSGISGSTLLQMLGRPSFSVDAGEWLHYADKVWDDAALSILMTTSGKARSW